LAGLEEKLAVIYFLLLLRGAVETGRLMCRVKPTEQRAAQEPPGALWLLTYSIA
jgi:hypothetical protein